MKRKEFTMVMASAILALILCVGCGNAENAQDNILQEEADMQDTQDGVSQEETVIQDTDIDTHENMEPVMEDDSSEAIIYTEYIPIDYRKNALIVQKSEDMELYGLLDDAGNIILEPKYDSLEFTLMNGKDYIKAKLVEDFGILNLDGTECVEMGQYENIVSAGDIGWLAQKDDKQFLLNEMGGVTRELKGKYRCCIGNRYLMTDFGLGQTDAGTPHMVDGNGKQSYEMHMGKITGSGTDYADVYDLDENILISGESKSILIWEWLIDGDKFGVNIWKKDKMRLKIIDVSGKSIAELNVDDNPNTSIVDVVMEEQKIILKSWKKDILEYDLNSKKITKTEYNDEDSWDSGIIMKKTGDFYQCYKEGELLFDERFADYSLSNGVLWLENTDSQ